MQIEFDSYLFELKMQLKGYNLNGRSMENDGKL